MKEVRGVTDERARKMQLFVKKCHKSRGNGGFLKALKLTQGQGRRKKDSNCR